MLNQKGDARHSFILFYVFFIVIYFVVLTPLYAEARFQEAIDYDTENVSGISLNNTTSEALEISSAWNFQEFFGALISFHIDNIIIDVLVLTPLGLYGIYIFITVVLRGT